MNVNRLRPLPTPGQSPHSGGVPRKGMTLVPGGSFRMGSAAFYPEEGPVITAEVQSLWVDDHPVTNAAFRRFVASTGHVTIAESAPDPVISPAPTRRCWCPDRRSSPPLPGRCRCPAGRSACCQSCLLCTARHRRRARPVRHQGRLAPVRTPSYCHRYRPAARQGHGPRDTTSHVGFRCVQSA